MKIAVCILAFTLVGCAHSSGVLKTGPEAFTISTSASPGKGGVPEAKRMAFEEAAAACRPRQVVVVEEKAASPTWTEGMARMDLTFRCE